MMKTENFSNGKFVISLDFELLWGVRDKRTIESYGQNILGVRKAIPAILALCDEFDVSITFSTVGFLFAKNKSELEQYIPSEKPAYADPRLSPYDDWTSVGFDENDDPYHFGYSLLEQIKAKPQHEIGTHTFCHYYCLEPGQTANEFRHDLMSARKIATDKGISVRSLVFPRNQFSHEYLETCVENGVESYRGNPVSWLYTARNENDETSLRRFLRLADAYINLTGHHCYSKKYITEGVIPNIAASRFLRPFSKKMLPLEDIRLRRITSGMSYAAKKKLLYHLWWHPHNFGKDLEQNINFLRQVFQHFRKLKEAYRYESITMVKLADEIRNENR